MARTITVVPQTYTATSALPYPHLEGRWRDLEPSCSSKLATGELPDWARGAVTGPAEVIDARGRVWWEYQAEVNTRDAGPVG